MKVMQFILKEVPAVITTVLGCLLSITILAIAFSISNPVIAIPLMICGVLLGITSLGSAVINEDLKKFYKKWESFK